MDGVGSHRRNIWLGVDELVPTAVIFCLGVGDLVPTADFFCLGVDGVRSYRRFFG